MSDSIWISVYTCNLNLDNFSCGLEPEQMSNSNDDKAFEQTKDDSFTCLNTHTPIPDDDIKGKIISLWLYVLSFQV